jgi:hypothetical protein
MIPVKIYCACGQKYSFEAQHADGKMPVPVACPVCGRDGTPDANRFLVKILKAKTQLIPPPKINSLLNSAQSNLTPHLMDALKDAVVQELAAQRRELLAGQQAAAAELTELARRLEAGFESRHHCWNASAPTRSASPNWKRIWPTSRRRTASC